ncbi:MAG TPA: aldehyde oxidase [Desulfotomaculum sp.]|nr:MAG: Xanthine dehydrogenase, molybdenum binding subunit apoprotein [Desulfotomaculum sp. 46_80]HAG11861.1 aldehyde oxidase [Desulfotomaculum sp.]HBY05110.1 aldehyde oxidase [Desulfotomaculum sp.]
MEHIGKPVKRFDFDAKVEGRAQYCSDIHFENMLYAKTLRSELSRAKITSIKIPEMPEGYFIVDHRDIPGENIIPSVYNDQPFFAGDEVKFIGEPILLVVGPDRQKVQDILKSIKVKYEPEKPVLSIEEAMELREGFIFGDKPFFVEYEYSKGNFEKAVSSSKFFVEDEFRTGYQEHAYLETQSMIGVYEKNCITVYGSMQCPYYIKDALKQALGWTEDRIRVVQLPTGGGFGGKEDYPSIPGVHAGLTAIKTGKPVQLVFDRQEDFIASPKRHPSIIKIRSYIDDHNRITAREVDIKTDAGAYAGLSSVVLQRISFSVCGVYNVENLKVTSRAYATNNIVTGAFRGFGGPQAFFAVEMHMENIAEKLNIDSLELKKKYFLKKGDTSSTGGLFNYEIKLDEIAEVIEKKSSYKRKRELFSNGKDQLRGIGCSIFFHGCGFTGDSEKKLNKSKVRLKKYKDNTVEIFASSTEIGQGSLTTLRKIVSRALGIPIEQVKHQYPDTYCCPDSGPTTAGSIGNQEFKKHDRIRRRKRRYGQI